MSGDAVWRCKSEKVLLCFLGNLRHGRWRRSVRRCTRSQSVLINVLRDPSVCTAVVLPAIDGVHVGSHIDIALQGWGQRFRVDWIEGRHYVDHLAAVRPLLRAAV
jgi:hypothetical protein